MDAVLVFFRNNRDLESLLNTWRRPGCDFADQRHQLKSGRLGNDSTDSRFFSLELELMGTMQRVHEHGARVSLLGDFLGRGDPIHNRHSKIEDDDVRLELINLGDRLSTVAGLPANDKCRIGGLQKSPKLLAHALAVVDDQDSNHAPPEAKRYLPRTA